MLVIGLNLTSIVHYNFLNSHLNFTVLAEEGEPTEDEEAEEESDEEDAEAADTDEQYRQAVVTVQEHAIEQAVLEQKQNYNETLNTFDTCVPTNIGDHNNEICNTKTSTEDKNFRRLLESIANNEIRTVLEEPLGNENIFKRARVCRTTFLKDRFGRLQPVGVSSSDKFYENAQEEIMSDLETVEGATSHVDTFFSGKEFLITTGTCEEFFVKSCEPQNERQTSIGEGDPLPVQVACDQVQVLFASSGSDLVKNYVGLIYRWAAGIIGVIAVLIIVIQGIRMSQSGGDQGKVDAAKNAIIQSLTALAVLFLAGILLSSINPNFFTQRDLQENPNIEALEEPSDPTE